MNKKIHNDYHPSPDEPFMNDRQIDYFRRRLLDLKSDIIKGVQETLSHLQEEEPFPPDVADRASQENERALELRHRDRERKLIAKVDQALKRIDSGTYGYCQITGEPISLERLRARPMTTLSLEAQKQHEQREKIYRNR